MRYNPWICESRRTEMANDEAAEEQKHNDKIKQRAEDYEAEARKVKEDYEAEARRRVKEDQVRYTPWIYTSRRTEMANDEAAELQKHNDKIKQIAEDYEAEQQRRNWSVNVGDGYAAALYWYVRGNSATQRAAEEQDPAVHSDCASQPLPPKGPPPPLPSTIPTQLNSLLHVPSLSPMSMHSFDDDWTLPAERQLKGSLDPPQEISSSMDGSLDYSPVETFSSWMADQFREGSTPNEQCLTEKLAQHIYQGQFSHIDLMASTEDSACALDQSPADPRFYTLRVRNRKLKTKRFCSLAELYDICNKQPSIDSQKAFRTWRAAQTSQDAYAFEIYATYKIQCAGGTQVSFSKVIIGAFNRAKNKEKEKNA